MSREDFDIPEVFRRAMEEAGWRDADKQRENGDNGDDEGGGPRRPFPPSGGRPPQINRSLWIIGILFILLLSFNWIVTTYTDWLWFTELDYASVWLRQWGVRVLSFIVTFGIALLIILSNWMIARRHAIKATQPFNPQFLTISGIRWLIVGIAVFLAFTFGSSGSVQWEELLLFINRVQYGVNDPIFGKDISFYLFELPVYKFVQGWVSSLLFVTLLGIIPIYIINSLPDIQRGNWKIDHAPALRKHVALLGSFFLGLWAVGHLFSIYELLYSGRGVVFGASYTDMNASLWALRGQMVLMALAALLLLVNVVKLNVRPFLIAIGLWLATAVLLGGVYPGLLQRYAVEPNEIERERPYIEHNIKFTRLAFDLDKIETRPFDLQSDLSMADIQTNQSVLNNVRLWDYRPLQATYEQLQALRPYYQFNEVDIDRYEIDGETRQVMLAVRELNKDNLPAPSWVNRNLEFTHGYGLVMNPVDKVTSDGQPEFFIQDLPPRSSIGIEITQPEIYYGESTTDSVFVSSGREEFSYPSGNENVYSSYSGTGGVPLNNLLKRVAFAVRLADSNVLLSDEIDDGTRIQFHREIQGRIRQITPFLALDEDPYIVILDGRLVWVQDAYTLSSRFPYATPNTTNTFNYLRNSVKIVVDAYHGSVDYYMSDPDDPIIQAYAGAFPGLFKSMDSLPEGLNAHLRYPEDLFTIQAKQYLTYHMSDVRVFYNKEDLWETPTEIFDSTEQFIEPYYVTLALPQEEDTEYLLIQPFSPSEKKNMVAWMAARNDPEHYGELVIYELPKQELIFGPLQIEGRIDQEPEISQQFSLWDQRGSRIIRGNLLVIPINGNFLYVEPIYLLSETSALPELKRVIVANANEVVMRETLTEALAALLTDSGTPVVEEPDDGGEEESTTTTAPPVSVDASVEELIQSANTHFEAAEAAQRAGDWATYGTEIEALNQDLEQLLNMTE